jgi:dolichol-phosphate mannosyltransferase
LIQLSTPDGNGIWSETVKLTIVSPTFNEAENVCRLVREVGAALSGIDYELLIADDNSPDRTWATAQELASQNPRVRVLHRMTNRGLSRAVIDGFLSSSSEYIGVIDADLQHDPAILPQMIAALDAGADIAVGSRYVRGYRTGTWTLPRRFQSWVGTKLAQSFIGVELTDPMSGYFVLRRADFNRIYTQLDSSGFKILLEIIARLAPSKLEEVPYTFRPRIAGQSKLSSKVIFQYLGQLWRLSSVSRYMSVRFIKFGLVGASGTLVNLCAFLILARLCGLRDWRISALASLIANLTNYIFNNTWTFVDRGHRGWSLLRGYLSYLAFSLLGLSASTLTFAGLTHFYDVSVHSLHWSRQSTIVPLGFQLAAILVGTIFNYELNKRFTWRDRARQPELRDVNLKRETIDRTAPVGKSQPRGVSIDL